MKRVFCLIIAAAVLAGCTQPKLLEISYEPKMGEMSMQAYYFPPEDDPHEGTWLNWPHHYTYGIEYRDEIEDIWVQMTAALHTGERVHIIAYNQAEQQRITALLRKNGINMEQIDFVVSKSDDVWARDTGPIFVYDQQNGLVIADFAFDGWGEKMSSGYDDKIPQEIAKAKGFPILDIPGFVLEGGAVELDGQGTLLAAKSSVVGKNRNPDLTISQVEEYLSQYLGVRHFIWLEGVADEDITDAHIDGMARFYDSKTLLTVSELDFLNLYEEIPESDYSILQSAVNADGDPYKIIELPMTKRNVSGLDYQGSYLNYYIGNDVVLVPVYGDENDAIALQVLSELYENKIMIPINVTALYQYGGMLHCITQQQPAMED